MIRFRFGWMASLAVVAMLGVVTCAYAQGPGGRRGGGPRGGTDFGPGGGGRLGGFLEFGADIDVSDAQRQQIRAIVTKAREDARPLTERLRVAAEARRKAMAARPVDDNQIRATTQALATAQSDLAVARAHLQDDVFNVLTPDQQAKVTAARERRQTRVEQRRQRTTERRGARQNRQPNN